MKRGLVGNLWEVKFELRVVCGEMERSCSHRETMSGLAHV